MKKEIQNSILRINELWHSQGAIQKLTIPATFPNFLPSAWEWALKVAENDSRLVSTVMRSALKGVSDDDSAMIYASRGTADAKVRTALINGVRAGAPVQLQINAINAKEERIETFLNESFRTVLKGKHPYGYSLDATLWVTGAEHTYNSHCDVGDHCLVQLHGKKIVKLWGPKKGFDDAPLFNFDFKNEPGRFAGEETIVELNAGEMVFFSKGVMHEISIPANESSVSFTLASSSVYPLKTMVAELREMFPELTNLRLKVGYDHWDKFRALVFNPSKYPAHFLKKEMPSDLKSEIFKGLIWEDLNENLVANRLDDWWLYLAERKKYSPTGPLPQAPADRELLLKKWEDERLAGKRQ